MFCFFFFQAEDGIRDGRVTGVQRVLFRSCSPARSRTERRGGRRARPAPSRSRRGERGRARPRESPAGARTGPRSRSEERRVGKEGRSQGEGGRWEKKEMRETSGCGCEDGI